jgi:hypothetical protein
MSRDLHSRARCAFRALTLLGLVAVAPGCSTFKATKGIDVAPFAQNTVGMVGEVQRAAKPLVWVQLKKYEALPSVVDVRQAFLPTRSLMRGIALYSTQVVSIYSSPISDSRKAAELSRYMQETVRPALATRDTAWQFLTQAELDGAIRDMRSAKTFLSALGAAQPVVSAALAFGNTTFDDVGLKIDAAASDIARRIETEFAPLKQQIADLEDLSRRGVRSFTLLARYRLGESAALDTLRSADPEMAEMLPAGKRPGAAALDAAEERLQRRLDSIQTLRTRLDSDFAVYRSEQIELDELRTQAAENVRLGRITLILWARSHQNLAAGITVPAAIDVMSMMRGAASKAVALP